jgi:hypothetical protein
VVVRTGVLWRPLVESTHVENVRHSYTAGGIHIVVHLLELEFTGVLTWAPR